MHYFPGSRGSPSTHPFHEVFALIKKIQRPALCQVLTGIRDRALNKTAKISTLMKLLFCGRQTIYKINKSNTVRQIMTSEKKNKAGKAYRVFFSYAILIRQRSKGGEKVKSCRNV